MRLGKLPDPANAACLLVVDRTAAGDFMFFAMLMVHAHLGVMAWEATSYGREVMMRCQVLAFTEVSPAVEACRQCTFAGCRAHAGPDAERYSKPCQVLQRLPWVAALTGQQTAIARCGTSGNPQYHVLLPAFTFVCSRESSSLGGLPGSYRHNLLLPEAPSHLHCRQGQPAVGGLHPVACPAATWHPSSSLLGVSCYGMLAFGSAA